jgi:hypothetical protein
MHNALLIDEVQRQIFRFCTSQDLAHLASCTHAFLDAALDLRWRDLSSIVGLLLLIPGVELQEGVIVRFFVFRVEEKHRAQARIVLGQKCYFP